MTMPDHQNVQAGSLSHPGGLLRHSDRVRAYYDSDAYLAQNVIVPIRARLVKDLLGDLHDARVLDLGCGDGSISRSLLAGGNRLTLVDFSAPMLKRARDATPPGAAVEFVESDLSDYQPSECFDVVMCVGVLAHVPSPPATMQHLGRWCAQAAGVSSRSPTMASRSAGGSIATTPGDGVKAGSST